MKKKKKKFKKAVLLLFPLLILYYLVSFKFASEIYYYNSSKSFITYIVYGAIIFNALMIVIFTVCGFKCIRKNKVSSYIWYFLFLILFILKDRF